MTSHQTALSDSRPAGRGHYDIFVQCAIAPDHVCASWHIRGYCDIVETRCGTFGNLEKLPATATAGRASRCCPCGLRGPKRSTKYASVRWPPAMRWSA